RARIEAFLDFGAHIEIRIEPGIEHIEGARVAETTVLQDVVLRVRWRWRRRRRRWWRWRRLTVGIRRRVVTIVNLREGNGTGEPPEVSQPRAIGETRRAHAIARPGRRE